MSSIIWIAINFITTRIYFFLFPTDMHSKWEPINVRKKLTSSLFKSTNWKHTLDFGHMERVYKTKVKHTPTTSKWNKGSNIDLKQNV